MAGIKLLLIPLALFLVVGLACGGTNIFKSSTPSIFGEGMGSVQQPVKYGQYRYTHYDPRVINYYRLNVFVDLQPVEEGGAEDIERGMPQIFPQGSARVISSKSRFDPRGQVQISVKDLSDSSRTGLAFEGWLFDEQSGYALSLGSFRTVGFGNGELDWWSDQYIDEYDYVFITEEPYPDYDPAPGAVVLQGRIPKPNYFYEREFAPVKKTYGYSLT